MVEKIISPKLRTRQFTCIYECCHHIIMYDVIYKMYEGPMAMNRLYGDPNNHMVMHAEAVIRAL